MKYILFKEKKRFDVNSTYKTDVSFIANKKTNLVLMIIFNDETF